MRSVRFLAAAACAVAGLFFTAPSARAFDDIQLGTPTATAHYDFVLMPAGKKKR